MSDPTLFQGCYATLGESNITGLIECVSGKQDEARDDLALGLNSFFFIYGGALVFFMQTGFAMLTAGSCRAKNVKHVILWNFLDSAGGAIAFWVTGYAFAYGSDDLEKGWSFIGTKGFFLQNTEIDMKNFFFQWAFACAVSSIIAGTIAERTQMKAYLLYSMFFVGFVYPVIAHTIWSYNGFLSNTIKTPFLGSGCVDLAGSGPVHLAGGVGALACVLVVGNRVGRFHDRDGNVLDPPVEMAPHSVTLQFLGTFCLWFGWYGFNPVSVLSTSSEKTGNIVALVAVNTTLGASAGALSGMLTSTLLDYFHYGYHTYDLAATMNGLLTGLAAVTAGCATVDTYGAIIIGIVAGWVYLGVSKLLIFFKIDDVVDAIPVHLGGGLWGVIATGLLSKPDLLANAFGDDMAANAGWFYEWGRGSGNFTLMANQLLEVAFVVGWTFLTMYLFYSLLNLLGWLRIDYVEEEAGLDISRHKGGAYDLTSGAANEDAVMNLQSSRHKYTEPAKKVEEDSDDADIVLSDA